ncbi:class I SAM-dependent methyltransferase [Salinimicrobium sp. CDJ15-81-2]|nr:class I SAM-dependent methyltransferase [Salinimicrobium nanhaiense]
MNLKAYSDKKGKETLDIISEADDFNRWMFETIFPFTKGKILEAGSGLGNISKFFLQEDCEIMLTDFRSEYCLTLIEKFKSFPNLLGVNNIDLIHPDFDNIYLKYLNSFDTVFALNVIEHIEDDNLAIQNCKKLLKEKGNLIILVPSYDSLYNKFDEELGHFRRYTRQSLSELFIKNNLKILHSQYFNFFGILGWFLSGKVLGKDTIPSSQMKLYNKMVPIWKIMDKLSMHRVGLSTIVIGQK